MTRLYRLLTEDDSSAFCLKVSQALADGWELHGDPVMSFDAARGVIRCGQAVIKEVGGTYSPDLKLGDQ
jgi:hypothetical protein